MRNMLAVWLFLAGWGGVLAAAAPPVLLTDAAEAVRLGGHVAYLTDPGRRLTLAQVMAPAAAARFAHLDQALPNLGTTSAAVWLRFAVVNRSRTAWMLEISNALLEDISFYRTAGGRLLSERRAGFFHPAARRDIRSNFYLFSLFAAGPPAPDTLVCYLRVVNSMPMQFPMQIATVRHLYEENHPIDVANGIYIGIVAVMILYNLFLYTSVRDRTYLYYVGYVFFSGLVVADFQGYVFDLLWRHTWPWVPVFDYVPAMLGNVFAILFAWHFLDTPVHTPRLHRGIRVLLAASAAVMGGGLVITACGLDAYKVWVEMGIQAVVFCTAIYMLGVGVLLLYRQKKPALFYVLAWTVFLIGTVVFILQIDGLVPNTFFSEHAIQIGSAVETLLLSLALADRINTYKQEREAAQTRYIRQLQENEHVRGRIARDLHDDIGSTLSSISILSQVARLRVGQGPGAAEMLDKISTSAQKMLDSMHDIVWATQPANDSLGSVAVRMREFAAEVLEAKHISYCFDIDEQLLALPLPVRHHYDFYLVFKEAVNNAAKYSEATQVDIGLHRRDGHLHLRIQDNGKGFDEPVARTGNGLRNMRKRADQLAGRLHIEARPGHGTLVELSLPLHPADGQRSG